MAQYRVLKKSYIHDRIYEPGEVVEWGGDPGDALEPIGNERRPPEPSRITGMPGPDPAAPPPQPEGKSEFDPGGPTRSTALEEYDRKRLADQEVDLPATEPQALARKAEADAGADDAGAGEAGPPARRAPRKAERPTED